VRVIEGALGNATSDIQLARELADNSQNYKGQ